MPKRKSPRRREARRSPKAYPDSATGPLTRIWRATPTWLKVGGSIGGLFLFVYSSWPSAVVTPATEVIREDPFQSLFVIQNTGGVALHNIHLWIKIREASIGSVLLGDVGVDRHVPIINKLSRGRKHYFRVINEKWFAINPDTHGGAVVEIHWDYRALWGIYASSDSAGFKTHQREDSQYVWLEHAF